jgi:dephospho-CoA kinase
MMRIGLTGGIATGKSTVQAMLEEQGYPVLDADAVYHELLATDAEMLADLRTRFGAACFDADGQLDRKALGEVVFADAEARRDLGALTHPRVRRRMVAWLEERSQDRPPPAAVFVSIPLLFENGLEALFDATWVVSCSPDLQLERLRARNDLDEEAARRRIASQMPLEEKERRADVVIVNDGARPETRARVAAAIAAVLTKGNED